MIENIMFKSLNMYYELSPNEMLGQEIKIEDGVGEGQMKGRRNWKITYVLSKSYMYKWGAVQRYWIFEQSAFGGVRFLLIFIYFFFFFA